MKKEIKIMNMDVYDDVTMGKIIFRIGEHEKAMKCLWRTVRVVVSFSTQSTVGVLPYRHTTWQNFGNNIYLLNYDESTVSDDDYRTLVRTLFDNGVNNITLQEDTKDREHLGENFLVNKSSVWEGWK